MSDNLITEMWAIFRIKKVSGIILSVLPFRVPDEAYGAGWNGSTQVPTKNAVYDKIETLSASPAVATGAEVNTGTDNAKFVSPLAMEDSDYVKAAYADAKVADAINNGTTTIAPSQNAVFDALALKQDLDTQLTDLASLSYAGNALKSVRVNAGETGFELATAAGAGDLVAANNLSDVASAATSRTNLGLGTGDSPTFTGLTLSSFLNEAKGANIAAAATTNIGAGTGNYIEITGSTTITAFDTVQAGTRRILFFRAAPLLTHNGTSLILPGAANIQAVAGDVAEFVSLGSGNWVCTNYAPGGVGVIGPASATDNAIARYNLTTGKIIQDSGVTIGDDGEILCAAGTTSSAGIKLQAGTNITTAEVGAIELDSNCMYGCTDVGNRGIIPLEHIIRLNATRTFANNTSQQAIFNDPTNGTLTLETGTYLFEGLIAITSMSATTGNGKFSIIGAGGATLGDILWQAYGGDSLENATGAACGTSWHTIATQTGVNIVTSGGATSVCFSLKGTFTVTVAGTIIPSFALSTGVGTAVASIGSYFKCNRIGSTSMVSVGQWT
jgi:hypothetical protein